MGFGCGAEVIDAPSIIKGRGHTASLLGGGKRKLVRSKLRKGFESVASILLVIKG